MTMNDTTSERRGESCANMRSRKVSGTLINATLLPCSLSGPVEDGFDLEQFFSRDFQDSSSPVRNQVFPGEPGA